MAKTILLTAADSFTGAWLKPALERRGHSVVGTSRSPAAPDLLELDISEESSVLDCVRQVKPQILINLAGVAFANQAADRSIYTANVIGALNFLQAFEAADISPEKLVFVSSATVYAAGSESERITEQHGIEPSSHYAASKAMLELALQQYAAQFPISVVRPFNYTGPGQRDIFFPAKVARCFRERWDELHVGNIDVVRDLSDVRDICELYCDLVESDSLGVVNFCSGRGIRMADLILECIKITGHEPRVSKNPRFVRSGEASFVVGSTERLESILGPIRFRPVEETMRAMLEGSESA